MDAIFTFVVQFAFICILIPVLSVLFPILLCILENKEACFVVGGLLVIGLVGWLLYLFVTSYPWLAIIIVICAAIFAVCLYRKIERKRLEREEREREEREREEREERERKERKERERKEREERERKERRHKKRANTGEQDREQREDRYRHRNKRASQTSDTDEINDLETACRILGIAVGADAATVKRAWREKCKKFHPDFLSGKGVDAEVIKVIEREMKKINAAYDYIKSQCQFQ